MKYSSQTRKKESLAFTFFTLGLILFSPGFYQLSETGNNFLFKMMAIVVLGGGAISIVLYCCSQKAWFLPAALGTSTIGFLLNAIVVLFTPEALREIHWLFILFYTFWGIGFLLASCITAAAIIRPSRYNNPI